MDDLISRQAAIGRAVEIPLFGKPVKLVAVSELEALPSAEPERKTGHWKFDWKNNKATCSECGHTFKDAFDIDDFDNFCRHCGTKMEVKCET